MARRYQLKIRVEYSDGVFRGGLLKLNSAQLHCRMWRGNPHPHFSEWMMDYSGHDNPSHEGSWFLLKMATKQDLSGPPCDQFDSNSFGIKLSPPEAVRWFRRHDYSVPPDLCDLARTFKKRGDEGDDNDQLLPVGTLTPQQQRIWDLLQNKAMIGKELAKEIYNDPSCSTAIRKHIEAIRRTGRTVSNQKPFGYIRPDALPPELAESSVSAPELTVKDLSSDAA